MSDVIGKLKGDGWEAELHKDGKFTSSNRKRVIVLNALYPFKATVMGNALAQQLYRAANGEGAEVVDLNIPEPVPGRVY